MWVQYEKSRKPKVGMKFRRLHGIGGGGVDVVTGACSSQDQGLNFGKHRIQKIGFVIGCGGSYNARLDEKGRNRPEKILKNLVNNQKNLPLSKLFWVERIFCFVDNILSLCTCGNV